MPEIKNEGEKRTVFAVINLKNSKEHNAKSVEFALRLSYSMKLPLVLFPNTEGSPLRFDEGGKSLHKQAQNIQKKYPHLVGRERICHKKPNLLGTSIASISESEHAKLMLLEIEDTRTTALAKIFGSDVWNLVGRVKVPVLLIPAGVEFDEFREMTIAIDSTNKMQKLPVLKELSNTFTPKVNLFVQASDDEKKQVVINAVLRNTVKYLDENDVVFQKPVLARNTKDFTKHLLRFASKNSQLLLIEVDPGRIDGTLKDNISKLLDFNQKFCVMLVTTKDVGVLSPFN